MNLFVTGGAGFIGSNFIHLALGLGHTVVNYDALTYAGNLENLADIDDWDHYTFVEANILDADALRAALTLSLGSETFDACINFAAESHVDRSIDAAITFTETNVLGTVMLLEATRRAGVPRFIQVSTDEVYGTALQGEKFSLRSPLRPSSPYSASKAAADHLALSFYHTHRYDVRVTRCTNNYGRFQYPEKFIPTIITRALRGDSIPVYGDGLQVRDWIFVDDHCEGILATIERGNAGETYLFGGSTEVRNIDLATSILTMLATKLGKSESEMLSLIEFVKDRPGHDRRYAMDWSGSNAKLGWSPKTEFSVGLERTIDWYLENRTWFEQLQQG